MPLPRFRLDADSSSEASICHARTSAPSANVLQAHYNARAHFRTRQSPCSDLQSTAIPEEHDCADELARQRCPPHSNSLDEPLAALDLGRPPPREDDTDDEEIRRHRRARRNYRYSLPDASPAALALRNVLKRNRTTKGSAFAAGLPSHSSHSLSTPVSTFRHFLSLVKLPSSRSINSAASHHSSLTTLTNGTSSSSTTLDQTTSSISAAMQWHFEVRTFPTRENTPRPANYRNNCHSLLKTLFTLHDSLTDNSTD